MSSSCCTALEALLVLPGKVDINLQVSDELAKLDVLANKEKQAMSLASDREAGDTLQIAASAAKVGHARSSRHCSASCDACLLNFSPDHLTGPARQTLGGSVGHSRPFSASQHITAQTRITRQGMKRASDNTLQGRTMMADMPAADGLAQANGSGRLRAWSGKLGSQLTTLKSRVGPNADQVTSTLRGLFQRQGSQDGQRYMQTS